LLFSPEFGFMENDFCRVHDLKFYAGSTCVVRSPAVLEEAWLDWLEMSWR
jgi:hypothetical protein